MKQRKSDEDHVQTNLIPVVHPSPPSLIGQTADLPHIKISGAEIHSPPVILTQFFYPVMGGAVLLLQAGASSFLTAVLASTWAVS